MEAQRSATSRGCECSASAEVMAGARLFIVMLIAVEAVVGVVVAVIGITGVVCMGNGCGVHRLFDGIQRRAERRRFILCQAETFRSGRRRLAVGSREYVGSGTVELGAWALDYFAVEYFAVKGAVAGTALVVTAV